MKHRTRIKICGITRLDQALHAAAMGVDSIGLVMHPASSRFLTIDQAVVIRNALPPFLTATVLLLNETEDWIAQVVHQIKPDCLQFHGLETAEFCEAWSLPYIKTISMGSTDDPRALAQSYPSAQGFLFDSNCAGRLGGSGDTFDWSRIPAEFDYPLILAGGLDPSNVAEAITRVKPWGVDVSSGVESSRGVKDANLVSQFVNEVRSIV